MKVEQIIILIASVSKAIQEVKKIYSTINTSGFFSPSKDKMKKLEGKIQELEDKIKDLESHVSSEFPKIRHLIRSYSRIIGDVRSAKSLSDKVREIIGNPPKIEPNYLIILANQTDNDYTRIKSSISELPSLNIKEAGELDTRLGYVGKAIQTLNLIQPDDQNRIRDSFNSISTEYSEIESILSNLLERILDTFNPSSK